MSSVEDTKPGSDNSAAKSIALDHLGDIAARIRALGKEMAVQPIPTFDEVISAADPVGAKALVGSHTSIDNCLSATAEEDDMYSVSLYVVGRLSA
jgi:cohesin loading factor subunit SCC2